MPDTIQIITERLLIRDHKWSDLESQHKLLTDPISMRYLPEIRTSTIDESRANLAEAISEIGAPERKRVFLRIERISTGEYIGEIGYTVTHTTPVGSIAHIGYFTRAECWGNGYATEALKAVLRYAFTRGGVYRMTTGCVRENVGSECVMRKSGMILEGVYPRAQWHEGSMKDRAQYRLLIDEWRNIDI